MDFCTVEQSEALQQSSESPVVLAMDAGMRPDDLNYVTMKGHTRDTRP